MSDSTIMHNFHPHEIVCRGRFFLERGIVQQTRDIDSLLDHCWASVVDGGPALNRQWFNYLIVRQLKLSSKQDREKFF